MRILRDDCRAIMRLLGDRSFDHVITDPPYSRHVHENHRTSKDGFDGVAKELGFDPLSPALRWECAQHFARIARRWILVFCDHEGGEAWRQDLIAAGAKFVRFGLWIKPNAAPQFTGDHPAVGHEVIVICHAARKSGRLRWNGGGKHAIWRHTIVGGASHERTEHTTQKPLGLMSSLVRDFTDSGEWILDPFAGSGSTLVACRRLGRRALGVEIDRKWALAADRRIGETREQKDLFEQTRRPNRTQLTFGLDGGAAIAAASTQR